MYFKKVIEPNEKIVLIKLRIFLQKLSYMKIEFILEKGTRWQKVALSMNGIGDLLLYLSYTTLISANDPKKKRFLTMFLKYYPSFSQ